MLALYIIFGIISVITILLLIPIKVTISFKEELFIKARYIITVYDSRSKKTSKFKKTKDSKGKKDTLSKIKSLFSSFDSVLELFKLIKNMLTTFGKHLKKVTVSNFKFSLTVAGDDAASIAIKYGLACSVIYPALTLATKTARFEPEQVDINTDFTSETFFVSIYSDVSVKPIYVLRLIISFVWIFIKSKMERNRK